MTSRDFCYWLQGYFELMGNGAPVTDEQAEIIRNHLALVFHHEIDPSMKGDPVIMQSIHDGKNGNIKTGPNGEKLVMRC
jgi:hypothetical protein